MGITATEGAGPQQQQADVVIVGGGIVGCTFACALLQGAPTLRIAIIEANVEDRCYHGSEFDPRVVALSGASVGLLQHLDVWPVISSMRASPYRAMSVWDGEGNGSIQFDSADIHRQSLGYIVENSVVLKALRERLAGHSQVILIAPAKVVEWQCVGPTQENQRITLDNGQVWSSTLVVAADGANSTMRKIAQIPTREWDYRHRAIVTTVKTERAHNDTAYQRFSSSGPLAFLPLRQAPDASQSPLCSIVWSQLPDAAERLMAMTDEEFCDELTRVSEGILGRVLWADRRYAIALAQMHAKTYGFPGFALIGDAAHRIHPLAGQGVNLGLYDAKALADEVTRAVKRRFSLGDPSVIKRYQRHRKVHNLTAMAAMEGFKRLFERQDALPLLLRNRGMASVDRLAWLKRWLMEAAAGEFLVAE